jgi:hypothetical protein
VTGARRERREPVVPGRIEDANYDVRLRIGESRDFGLDAYASRRNDGNFRNTAQILGAIRFATNNPTVAAIAVTVAPQHTSTAATGQVQCLRSASDVRSKVA